jgi:hypothetical protein
VQLNPGKKWIAVITLAGNITRHVTTNGTAMPNVNIVTTDVKEKSRYTAENLSRYTEKKKYV